MIRHKDGRTFRFGRIRPTIQSATPRFERFLSATVLPPPAVRADWAKGPALNKTGLENILGNDALGDCVSAACGHLIDIWHADAGTGVSVTTAQTEAFYSATTGYIPGKPNTDNGSDPVAVLDYWKTSGFMPGAQPIAGYVAVDPTNITAIKTAIALFGGVLIGGNLLTAWVKDMNKMAPGFTWDGGSTPDPKAGHEILGYGYNSVGVFVATWGMFGTLTWRALAEFADESTGGDILCPLSSDWIAKAGLAPSGLDLAQLKEALAAL